MRFFAVDQYMLERARHTILFFEIFLIRKKKSESW